MFAITPPIFDPAIFSASSTDFLMAEITSFGLTTIPFSMPFETASPKPTI